MKAQEVLQKYFGYPDFRPGQKEIIEAILKKKDALAIMPTGAGKSICYQVPALMMPGITLVISPLISLMMDQVKSLKEAGIPSAFINSSLTEAQMRKALMNAENGMYRIIYVAPERLETERFRRFAANAVISMVTVDEAHCISQWGQDFRPSYRKIVDFIESLPKRPVVTAFTATATAEVKEDILKIMKLKNPAVVMTGFDRKNLYYKVENKGKKDDLVVEYVLSHADENGIVYCSTRKNCEKVYELLIRNGVSCAVYHAGMSNVQRKKNQEDFVYDRIRVIIATNAFGMGIDKPDVRFVIHYNMPSSMENYYQEAGRAGRDGADAECIMLYSPQDIYTNRFLLDHKEFADMDEEAADLIRRQDSLRLNAMVEYCTMTGCLRHFILRYFGENAEGDCGRCGNCSSDFMEMDVSLETRWILNCIAEAGQRYGTGVITGALTGSKNARLREIGADQFISYGKLKGTKEAFLKNIIPQLIEQEYISQSHDHYKVLRLGSRISELEDPAVRVIVKVREENVARSRKVRKSVMHDDSLFAVLKKLRMETAKQYKVPPYLVFTDKTLIDMCSRMPVTKEEMLQVSGVAETKYRKYGRKFLQAIIDYQSSRD